MNNLIKGENVGIAYDGRRVLSSVNFSIDEGEILCIIGENGSGKTSLIKGILGIKKLADGSINFSQNNHKIGYLAQKDQIQKDFPAKIKEVVLSGRLNHIGLRPFYSTLDKGIAEENMRRLDILSIKDKSFNEISGGQRQRVLLARALCATGKLLVLDEPESSLDPVVTKSLYQLITDLKKDKDLGIIIVSHSLQNSLSIADKVLHLKAFGEEEHFFGTIEEYLRSDLGKGFIGGERC